MDSVLFHVRAILGTTAARWLRLTDQVPGELPARRPAPGAWAARDCLGHLLDSEITVFPVRVRAFLAGQDIPTFDPGAAGRDYARLPPTQLAADFARYRAQSLVLFEQLTSADLARSVRHSELGLVTLGQMLHEWAAHDLMHTVQAERALMQPFVAGSGPWRSTFADHDAGGGDQCSTR